MSKLIKADYTVSEGAYKVLAFLAKYKFYVEEPTVIDGRALKEFIEEDVKASILELVNNGTIELIDVKSTEKTITLKLLRGAEILVMPLPPSYRS